MTDFEGLLGALNRHRVEYIVVGGAAAIALGSLRFTQDLDIVHNRSPKNLERLAAHGGLGQVFGGLRTCYGTFGFGFKLSRRRLG